MNQLTFLAAAVVLSAVIGYFGRKAAERGVGESYWCFHHATTSTFLLALLIGANYVMAATAVSRLVGQEKSYEVKPVEDNLGWVMFGAHQVAVAPLFAITIVLFSIVAAGVLGRSLKTLIKFATGGGGVRPDIESVFGALLLAPLSASVVAFDALLMGLRLAVILFPEKLGGGDKGDGGLDKLPPIWQLGGFGTAAGSFLLVGCIAYPAIILIAERNFARAWARYISLHSNRALPAAHPPVEAPRPVEQPAQPAVPPHPPTNGARPHVPDEDPEDFIRPVPPAHA